MGIHRLGSGNVTAGYAGGFIREEFPTCIPRPELPHCYGINVGNSEAAATRIMTIPCTSIVACHLPSLPPARNFSEYNEDDAGSRPNDRDAIPALYRLPGIRWRTVANRLY